MRFALAYDLPPRCYLALRETVAPESLRAFRKGYWSWCALVASPSLLGLVLAISAANVFFTVIFAAFMVAMLFQAARYKLEHHKVIAAEAAKIPAKPVQLVIDGLGISETTAGVQSFAPWKSVQSTRVATDTVLIQLRSGSWCLIPASAFGDAVSLAGFSEFVHAQLALAREADA